MLKAVVDSLDGVPEALHEFYAESDGNYVLAVQGMVPKSKVDEFRNNNVDLTRQMEELKNTVDSIDLDKYNEMMQKIQDDEAASLIKAGKIDELVEMKSKAQTDHFNAELAKTAKERDALIREMEGIKIDTAVKDAALKSGVTKTAIDDVLLRARNTFKLQEGKVTPLDGEGNVIYSAGTTDPLSISGWMDSLSESAPHLFAPSSGGGSKHNSGAPTGKHTISSEKFETMGLRERGNFLREGGKIAD